MKFYWYFKLSPMLNWEHAKIMQNQILLTNQSLYLQWRIQGKGPGVRTPPIDLTWLIFFN